MHVFGLVLFGLIAFFWLTHGLRTAYGAMRLPWIKDFAVAGDPDCPKISLIFAARDEEEKLPAALATLAAIDYPNLEIIGVDDRSQDATGRILDEFATAHERFLAVHVSELPPGWLGKPHALQRAYESSSGELLLFTDADVRFHPEALRRAVSLAKQRNLDYLTLFGHIEMVGFWEKALLTFFGMAFYLASDPYRFSNPNSRVYVGVGAFQLIKRTAYETVGTHRQLAMEVVDDMKLGKLVKKSRLRCGMAVAPEFAAIRWHAGVGNMIRGVTKNFFAALNFNIAFVVFALAGLLAMNVMPFVGLILGQGWIRVFCAVAVVIALWFHANVNIVMRVSPWYAFTHPLGALILGYMLLRSTVITLKQGGIYWRGTFYPIEELRRGLV